MKHYFILLVFCSVANTLTAQQAITKPHFNNSANPPSLVDFNAYEKLTAEVNAYRYQHLISLDTFLSWGQQKDVIILDTRSDSMYNAKHVKGAIHLNFSDFSQESLRRLIPNPKTKILIYCNNNFDGDQRYFVTKAYVPPSKRIGKPITLALNIPTYINLYGYGYRNVYELADLVSVFDGRIRFEGTSIK